MRQIQQYDTIILLEDIENFQKGEKGAIIEHYTEPHEAYDIEMVTDEGLIKGLLDAVRPEQVTRYIEPSLYFQQIQIEADGAQAFVLFSDGTKIMIKPSDLYLNTSR